MTGTSADDGLGPSPEVDSLWAALVARDADLKRATARIEHERQYREKYRDSLLEHASKLRARDAELAGLREQLGVARGDDSAGEPNGE